MGLCLLGASWGCGGRLSTETPRGSASGVAQARAERTSPKAVGNYRDENSVGMAQDRVGKWRWKGERKECYFLTGNKCFLTKEQACKAASCGRRDCKVQDEGAPVRVMCEGEDATAEANAERQAIKERNEKARGEFDDSKFRRKKREFTPKKSGKRSRDKGDDDGWGDDDGGWGDDEDSDDDSWGDDDDEGERSGKRKRRRNKDKKRRKRR